MIIKSKRDMLVEAAANRFHRLGLPASSIAEVANDAGIPSGNVYYYFRTKDALAAAVQECWERRTADSLDDIDAGHDDAPSQIHEFLDRSARNAPIYVEVGCPIAALSRDFRNGGPTLQTLAGRIFEHQARWLRSKFAQMGMSKREQADAAWAILTSVQGGIGLAHATSSEAPFHAGIADARQRVATLVAANCEPALAV